MAEYFASAEAENCRFVRTLLGTQDYLRSNKNTLSRDLTEFGLGVMWPFLPLRTRFGRGAKGREGSLYCQEKGTLFLASKQKIKPFQKDVETIAFCLKK